MEIVSTLGRVVKLDSDPIFCPLCGQPNGCVMESATPGAACWCQSSEFSEALLARVPEDAKRKVCICAKCAAAAAAATPASRRSP